jgi:hypothetical protein
MLLLTALLMITGLVVLTWSFHNLELTDRPEWMSWEMLIWPLLVFGLVDGGRWIAAAAKGIRTRVDGWRLLMHGAPALFIALMPPGFFTNLFGAQVSLALLDFPTAKVMAAFWFAATIVGSWEVAF